MNISAINPTNINYASKVGFNARKSNEAILRDFKNFIKENHMVITAKLTPEKDSFRAEIELAKEGLYSTSAITDNMGYAITSSGDSLDEAVVNMAKKYRGQDIYSNTGTIYHSKMPNFFA